MWQDFLYAAHTFKFTINDTICPVNTLSYTKLKKEINGYGKNTSGQSIIITKVLI